MSTNHHFHKALFSFLLIASLVLANVSVAFADDGAPPGVTPEPTAEPADPPVTETPTPEGQETPPVQEQAPVEGEVAAPALFEQVPADTAVVVLNESGEVIPLASEQALNVVLDTDPMWCPAGVMPGGPGCTTNFATISLLLTDMRNNTGNYTQNGVIYFTANPGASFTLTTAGASLGAGDFDQLNDFSLTLQGGWNGLSGAGAAFSGQSNFGSNTLTIGTSSNPWVGNITINDFVFNNVTSGNAVTVFTTSGNITLNNVDVAQQGGGNYTAQLDSQSGNITVQNGSTFDGNNSGNNQNRGFSADTNTGAINITGTGASPITFTDANGCGTLFGFCVLPTLVNYNGVTLSAPVVNLANVTASNNDLNGIQILNANSVTLTNVTAINNGTDLILQPDSGDAGAGVLVNGTGATVVNISGGTFTGNERYGVEVTSGSIVVVSASVCSGNDLGCLKDNRPPLLNLPANLTIEAVSATGAVATYSATATDNIDGNLPVTCLPASGSNFPIGVTTVNCSATDSNSLTASGSFTVTVRDTTAPALTLPANMAVEAAGPGGAVVTYSASASDLVDGSVSLSCSPASGATFPIGVTTVNCSASDARNNTASGSFTVTVQDTTAPLLSLPANIAVEATGPSGASVTFTASATDLVDGSLPVICSPASGATFPVGITTVNCSASDSRNNTASGSFTVTVKDTTAPVIAPHADMFVLTHKKVGGYVFFTPPAFSDTVDGSGTATCSPVSGSLFVLGITTVTCTATDSHGNAATPVTFLVNVEYEPKASTLKPVTGGALDLDCLSTMDVFGITLAFHNLCGHQTEITELSSDKLPGQLPDGVAFVGGLDIDILFNGSLVTKLPSGAGIEVDFPIADDAQGQFAVLYWDAVKREWLDVTQTMKDEDIPLMLSTDAEDELYQILPTDTTKALYRILTTEQTGAFVIVKK